MATVEKSRISSEGLELLNSFTSGLDDLIYEIAEENAKRREPLPGEVVCIEACDVREATEIVFRHLRGLVKTGELPREIESIIDGMERCSCGRGRTHDD